jgi:hypothetical protein
MELRQGEIGLDEDLLGEVIGRSAILDETVREMKHFSFIPFDEGFEGVAAPLLSLFDERRIFHTITWPSASVID